ncbi:nuclear transport factor 2 family protein [Demetria terragena]|uniref:nuclear transport factor 2 family protein n=1 Tax=Demetria terragena TaxID=63959 RepID=UPI00037E5E38|nr:nuclear transport factor 2 family protein [Demetria terragena]
MGTDHHATVRRHWETCEARDWEGLGDTVSADVVYEMPQTRERLRGREAYVRFNREYPGDWHLNITRVVADAEGAVSWANVTVGEEHLTGIAFFTFDDEGRIATVQDFWPEPYDPPAGRAQLAERA